MEKEERMIMKPPLETEVFLQWGSRKRLRCVRLRGSNPAEVSSSSNTSSSSRIRRRITHRFLTLSQKEASFTRYTRNSEAATIGSESGKEEIVYHLHQNDNSNNNGVSRSRSSSSSSKKMVWPKVSIGLSSKEKEEDFMAMKGCKLPQRPKKRAKVIQRTLLLVSPGAWLNDMCLERYQVKEKKSCKKKAGGLKAMGSIESDSE